MCIVCFHRPQNVLLRASPGRPLDRFPIHKREWCRTVDQGSRTPPAPPTSAFSAFCQYNQTRHFSSLSMWWVIARRFSDRIQCSLLVPYHFMQAISDLARAHSPGSPRMWGCRVAAGQWECPAWRRVKTGFRWGYNGFLLGEDCQEMEEISSKLCSCLTCIWRTVYNPTPTVIK